MLIPPPSPDKHHQLEEEWEGEDALLVASPAGAARKSAFVSRLDRSPPPPLPPPSDPIPLPCPPLQKLHPPPPKGSLPSYLFTPRKCHPAPSQSWELRRGPEAGPDQPSQPKPTSPGEGCAFAPSPVTLVLWGHSAEMPGARGKYQGTAKF